MPRSSPTSTSREARMAQMESLRQRVLAALPNEPLARNRHQWVFGSGDVHASIMFIGEAPGADEEIAGEPFVGRAGQLLMRFIGMMGLTREQVYIANILKWRPDMPTASGGIGNAGNRKPRRDEMNACLPYLIEQIAIVQPRCIVALGATAMEGLTGKASPMRELRGQWHTFEGTPLMATYHPAYLLRNQSQSEKRKVWEDLLKVMEALKMPISKEQRGYFLGS